jgi:hypothetical protein
MSATDDMEGAYPATPRERSLRDLEALVLQCASSRTSVWSLAVALEEVAAAIERGICT